MSEIEPAFPFGRQWPKIPSGPVLSVRDVSLLDLARHAAMRAAMPLGTIQADTNEMWGMLKGRADDLGPDLDLDDVLTALEPGAHEWAKERTEARIAENLED